jgi:hypothetical protein
LAILVVFGFMVIERDLLGGSTASMVVRWSGCAPRTS